MFVVSVQSAFFSSFNHIAQNVIPFRGIGDKPMLQQFTRGWPLKCNNEELGLIITGYRQKVNYNNRDNNNGSTNRDAPNGDATGMNDKIDFIKLFTKVFVKKAYLQEVKKMRTIVIFQINLIFPHFHSMKSNANFHRIWVVFKQRVYDITDFVKLHCCNSAIMNAMSVPVRRNQQSTNQIFFK